MVVCVVLCVFGFDVLCNVVWVVAVCSVLCVCVCAFFKYVFVCCVCDVLCGVAWFVSCVVHCVVLHDGCWCTRRCGVSVGAGVCYLMCLCEVV